MSKARFGFAVQGCHRRKRLFDGGEFPPLDEVDSFGHDRSVILRTCPFGRPREMWRGAGGVCEWLWKPKRFCLELYCPSSQALSDAAWMLLGKRSFQDVTMCAGLFVVLSNSSGKGLWV